MLSLHKTGSSEKPDLLNIMCTFTNIQKYVLLKLVALEQSLIKYTFYPVVQTRVKFILVKVMRQGFAFSCITVVCFLFLQKLSSEFALKLSNLPVLIRLWSIWHWMVMSSLMGTPALAVWKHHCPFRVAVGIWSCKRPSCGFACSWECTFSDIWFSRKQPLPLCKALCALGLHRQGEGLSRGLYPPASWNGEMYAQGMRKSQQTQSSTLASDWGSC